MFDRCRKKTYKSDKNVHTCTRFDDFSVISRPFLSHGFS